MRVLRAIGLSLSFAFGFVACASGGGGAYLPDGGSSVTEVDSAGLSDGKRSDSRGRDAEEEEFEASVVPSKDSGGDTKKSDGPKACVSLCSTDFECQASCPPFGGAGAIACCDTFSGVCYAASSGSCPLADGGVD